MQGDNAPDFSDPLGLLAACHRRMLGFCELLERMCDYQDTHGVDTDLIASAERLLRYFDNAAPLHHQDEEQDLFPCLQTEPQLQGLCAQLQAEHPQHDALWRALRPQLLAISEGTQADDLAKDTAPFVAAYRAHIQLENEQLLPRAASLLDAGQLRAIGEAMRARRR